MSNENNENENENENEELQAKINEEFVEMVKNWVKIDDTVREYNNKIKDLKNEKKEYEEFILEYMDKIDEKVIDITGGKLRRNTSKSRGPLKQEMIQSALYDITNDSVKSLEMTKIILDKRPMTERVNLKRTRQRKAKTQKNV